MHGVHVHAKYFWLVLTPLVQLPPNLNHIAFAWWKRCFIRMGWIGLVNFVRAKLIRSCSTVAVYLSRLDGRIWQVIFFRCIIFWLNSFQDVNDDYSIRYPKLYLPGQTNQLFNVKLFFVRFVNIFVHLKDVLQKVDGFAILVGTRI